MSFKTTLLAVGLTAAASASHAATLSISCGAVGLEYKLCKQESAQWARQTGNKVKVVSTPNSSTERLALYQQVLAAGSSDIDVLQIDVIWPGILGNYFVDLTPYARKREHEYFSAMIKNDTVGGKLVAMPWYTDAGVLYYRKDLLAKYHLDPPKTWGQLAQDAKTVLKGERAAGDKGLQGYVWQGKAYEGLTCDALEWVKSFNGGTIVNRQGKVTIDNPNAIKAINTAASWIGTISPEGVLNYAEEDARGVFQSGHAVFMRNWPYAWALANSKGSPVKGKVGVTVLPKGGADGQHAAALGGWQLAVSRYSKHPKLAAQLVMYLTSPKVQKERAIKGSYNPTVKKLYKDPQVLAAVPFFGSLYKVMLSATPRPSTVTGRHYNQVSNAFWNAVHSVLDGSEKASQALGDLKTQLNHMSRGGRWH